MGIYIYILILVLHSCSASECRPVTIQQEFTNLKQCQYVYQTLSKQNSRVDLMVGGCFLK